MIVQTHWPPFLENPTLEYPLPVVTPHDPVANLMHDPRNHVSYVHAGCALALSRQDTVPEQHNVAALAETRDEGSVRTIEYFETERQDQRAGFTI